MLKYYLTCVDKNDLIKTNLLKHLFILALYQSELIYIILYIHSGEWAPSEFPLELNLLMLYLLCISLEF